jgi:hypothetical protein
VADLEDLAREIRELPLPDRLRLATELLERGRPAIAERIARDVVLELEARRRCAPRAGG